MDITPQGLVGIEEFKLGNGGFCAFAGRKFEAVKTVREVYADIYTNVLFIVVEYTPKKGTIPGPLFQRPSIRKAHGPVWHVYRWDFAAFKTAYKYQNVRMLDDDALVDLAVQRAQTDGLRFVPGLTAVGVGPWPKRLMALAALNDVARRERMAYDAAADEAWEASARAASA
jgi:hypothetical protein